MSEDAFRKGRNDTRKVAVIVTDEPLTMNDSASLFHKAVQEVSKFAPFSNSGQNWFGSNICYTMQPACAILHLP